MKIKEFLPLKVYSFTFIPFNFICISAHEKYIVDVSLSEEEELMCNEPDVVLTGNHIISQNNTTDIQVSI